MMMNSDEMVEVECIASPENMRSKWLISLGQIMILNDHSIYLRSDRPSYPLQIVGMSKRAKRREEAHNT